MPEEQSNFFKNVWKRFTDTEQADTNKIEPPQDNDTEPSQNTTTEAEDTTSSEEDENEEEENEGEQEGGLLESARDRQGSARQYPASPIKAQKREPKGGGSGITRDPVEIVFLTGKYQGKKMNLDPKDSSFLGTGIEEISQEQSAEWQSDDSDQIRSGSNFKGISARSISFSLTFYHELEDVSHLVEQLFLMQEVDAELGTPPLLHVSQGHMELVYSVCERIKPKYQYPLLRKQGFHLAKVELSFKMHGGKGSPHAFAPPLTSTPLGDAIADTTETEREMEAAAEKTKLLLGDCLGEQGKKDLEDFLEEGGGALQDVDRILELSSDTRLQLAIAGAFPTDVVKNKRVREKLKEDLAISLAQSTNGVSFNDRELAEALVNDNSDLVPNRLKSIWEPTRSKFQTIWGDLKQNNLGEKGETFKSENGKAQEALVKLGSCGLSLRQSGGVNFPNIPSGEDAEAFAAINEAIKTHPDRELKELFGLQSQTQVDALKDGHPYAGKGDFVQHFSRSELQADGYALIAAFEKNRQ